MLIPDNIHPEDSVYYNSSVLVDVLLNNTGLDLIDLYTAIQSKHTISFPLFVLCVDWLYLMNIATIDKGKVTLCS